MKRSRSCGFSKLPGFLVAALSSSFNKSFLLIASPSFSFKLVRFVVGLSLSFQDSFFRCSVVRFF